MCVVILLIVMCIIMCNVYVCNVCININNMCEM